MRIFIAIIAAYLLGSIPFGYIVGKLHKIDIREHGSGNIGATNTFRVLGLKSGIIVVVLDAFKGALSVLIAKWLGLDTLYQVIVGIFATIGHTYTCFLHFKGGKGVATAAGTMAALSLPVLCLGLTVFGITIWITKYVSLGSILGVLSAALFSVLLHKDIEITIFVLIVWVVIVYKHKENIKRILNGTENKVGKNFGKGNND